MVKNNNISTDGKFVGITIGEIKPNHKLGLNEDGSMSVHGELEDKTIFDTLIDKIERDVNVNELTLCKDNIEIYMKFMSDSKWGDWKLKRVDHAKRLSKIMEELSGSKVIELIELGYSRQVLKIDDIVKSLGKLIDWLYYTLTKYSELSTYSLTSKITTEGNKLALSYTPFSMVSSPLGSCFKVDSDIIDDFKIILNKNILLNLTGTGEKYRCIGKTTLLLKLCKNKNATLIISNHHIKKILDKKLKESNCHIPIIYLGKDVNLEGTDFNYYVDEGISKEQLEKLINQNNNCLGGFVNHESFK